MSHTLPILLTEILCGAVGGANVFSACRTFLLSMKGILRIMTKEEFQVRNPLHIVQNPTEQLPQVLYK